MDDFTWAHRHSDCCDLFCRRIFSSSRVCAAPGFPLEKITPSWVPFPSAWGYLTGAILLAAGIGLALTKKSRMAAISIGALMTVLTLFLYLPIWILARGGTTPAIMEAINYVFDTWLYAGTALVLASALPRDPDHVEKTSVPPVTLSGFPSFG
jgi:hypothetical protein